MRGESKSKKLLRLRGTSISDNTSEGERKFDLPKPRLVRPKFPRHICKSESGCTVCKDFINSL